MGKRAAVTIGKSRLCTPGFQKREGTYETEKRSSSGSERGIAAKWGATKGEASAN